MATTTPNNEWPPQLNDAWWGAVKDEEWEEEGWQQRGSRHVVSWALGFFCFVFLKILLMFIYRCTLTLMLTSSTHLCQQTLPVFHSHHLFYTTTTTTTSMHQYTFFATTTLYHHHPLSLTNARWGGSFTLQTADVAMLPCHHHHYCQWHPTTTNDENALCGCFLWAMM